MSNFNKPTNPPAFPTNQYANGISPSGFDTGITMRDYFAASAMQAFISSWISRGAYPETDMVIVEHAYAMADAMLKARETNGL